MANLQSLYTAFAGYHYDAILSSTGAPVVNTPVTIYESDGSTAATCYTDQTRSTTTSNVINTDAYGNLAFYTNPGEYVLSYTVGGVAGTSTVTVTPWFSDAAWNVVLDSIASPGNLVSGDCRFANASTTAINYSLPTTVLGGLVQGGRFKFIKTDSSANTVTINASGADIIGGGGSFAAWGLTTQGQTLSLFSDGINWYTDNILPGALPKGNMYLSSLPSNIASSSWNPFGPAGSFIVTGTAGSVVHETALGFDSLKVLLAGTYHCCGGVKWPTGSGTLTVGGSVWHYVSSGSVANGNHIYLPASATSPVTVTFAMDVECAAGDNLALAGYTDAAGQTCTTDQTWLDVRLASY